MNAQPHDHHDHHELARPGYASPEVTPAAAGAVCVRGVYV